MRRQSARILIGFIALMLAGLVGVAGSPRSEAQESAPDCGLSASAGSFADLIREREPKMIAGVSSIGSLGESAFGRATLVLPLDRGCYFVSYIDFRSDEQAEDSPAFPITVKCSLPLAEGETAVEQCPAESVEFLRREPVVPEGSASDTPPSVYALLQLSESTALYLFQMEGDGSTRVYPAPLE